MIYHFTAIELLPRILRHGGLEKGHVVVAANLESLEATWLTINSDPFHAGVSDGRRKSGSRPERLGAQFARGGSLNKQAVRITVKMSPVDEQLFRWEPFVRGRLGPSCMEDAVRRAGGPRWIEDWFFYIGLLPARDFVRIEIRDGNTYRLMRPEEIPDVAAP